MNIDWIDYDKSFKTNVISFRNWQNGGTAYVLSFKDNNDFIES